jgi:hypothetical protein
LDDNCIQKDSGPGVPIPSCTGSRSSRRRLPPLSQPSPPRRRPTWHRRSSVAELPSPCTGGDRPRDVGRRLPAMSAASHTGKSAFQVHDPVVRLCGSKGNRPRRGDSIGRRSPSSARQRDSEHGVTHVSGERSGVRSVVLRAGECQRPICSSSGRALLTFRTSAAVK